MAGHPGHLAFAMPKGVDGSRIDPVAVASDASAGSLSRQSVQSLGQTRWTAEARADRCPSWYVIHTGPAQETLADCSLTGLGFETFLPLYQRQCRRRGGVARYLLPLLPSYLFIRLDLAVDRWWPVRSAPGVHRLLARMQQDAPGTVTDADIERLRRLGNVEVDESGVAVLEPGQAVEILDGPFTGFRGSVLLATEGRVSVLTAIFGREVRTTLPRVAVAGV